MHDIKQVMLLSGTQWNTMEYLGIHTRLKACVCIKKIQVTWILHE